MRGKWQRHKLTAEFLSDAHLGSGTGGGGIDALIARDRHDRPVIWASHVEGVLRDAARRLHGDSEAGKFFGRAGGETQRATFTSLYAAENSGSHLWCSTARNSFDNRAPKDDTLRVVEYVPKGTKLVGEVELPASDSPTLQRLVQEVDALGGGRANGAGRVKLSLEVSNPVTRKVGTATGRLVLLLKNRDPLCITATASPDNLIPSLAFVPGRALLGAIANWLISEGDRVTAALLTSGKISVSDALPLPHQPNNLSDVEVLPAPLSLQSEKPKDEAGDVPWWARSITSTKRMDAWSSEKKLKRPDDDLFVYRANPREAWKAYKPARRVRLRNGRPDPKQADTSLYAIEQLVEETYFLADLRGETEALKQVAEGLAAVLLGQRWLRLGRGGAPVEVAESVWSRATPSPASTDKALLIMTSDLLVRDETLRWITKLSQKHHPEQVKALFGEDVQLDKELQDNSMVHGFNGTSRLWRMPAAAIRRGSVFELSGAGVAKLAERAAKGDWLGERTHEGFGRFRLDTSLPGVTDETPPIGAFTPTADSAEEAIAMRTHEWFRSHRSLANSGKSSDRKPSLSQWFKLVTDLERGAAHALSSRLNPTTAGGKCWQHPDARYVLDELNKIGAPQQQLYARYFVRWLRVEMRKAM
jgi:hypothetical protein